MEGLHNLLDPSPQAKLPFTLRVLRERAIERSSRSTEFLDYMGLASKLQWLVHSEAFDQANMRGLDPAGMLKPGRVSVIDVSVANDIVKNLVTADLLRKTFAYKIAHAEAAADAAGHRGGALVHQPREGPDHAGDDAHAAQRHPPRPQALAVDGVRQPAAGPPAAGDFRAVQHAHRPHAAQHAQPRHADRDDGRRHAELWARCPLLGTGEAMVSSPQLRRPVIVNLPPACSRR